MRHSITTSPVPPQRYGVGVSPNFFSYSHGGVVVMRNAALLKGACVPSAGDTAVAASAPRPPGEKGG